MTSVAGGTLSVRFSTRFSYPELVSVVGHRATLLYYRYPWQPVAIGEAGTGMVDCSSTSTPEAESAGSRLLPAEASSGKQPEPGSRRSFSAGGIRRHLASRSVRSVRAARRRERAVLQGGNYAIFYEIVISSTTWQILR
jgi:hypothetical protein